MNANGIEEIMAKLGGYTSAGHVLINRLNDGVSIDAVWQELYDATNLWNEHTDALVAALSSRTREAGRAYAQGFPNVKMSVATEFGVPEGVSNPSYIKCGSTLRTYDLATRFTARALQQMSSGQVAEAAQQVFAADQALQTGLTLQRILNPQEEENEFGIPCKGLWNADGQVPPPYNGIKFDGTASHYLTSGSNTLDAADIENAVRLIKGKGYAQKSGSKILVIMNSVDYDLSGITTFRRGVEHDTGKVAGFDFIIGPNSPAYYSAEEVKGALPPADFGGLEVSGSYAGALVIQSNAVPAGWVIVAASGGAGSVDNPVLLREPVQDEYTGLRLIPGHWHDYPLVESFYVRQIGSGTAHRGAAVAIQLTTENAYTAPVIDFVN